MADDLRLEISVDDRGAKQVLADTDRAVDKIGGTAQKTGAALSDYEQQVQKLVASKQAATTVTDTYRTSLASVDDFIRGRAIGSVQALTSAVGVELPAGFSLAAAAGLGFLGLMAAAGVAAVSLAFKVAEAGARLNDLSETTGLTVPSLSRLSNAAYVAGTDISKLSAVVVVMQQRMAEDPTKFAEGLHRIGLEFGTFKQLAPEDQLLAVATALQAQTDPIQRNAAGLEIMGRQYREIAPALGNLNEALEKTATLTPWTEDEARRAEEFQMQVKAIDLQLQQLKVTAGRDVLPTMTTLLELLPGLATRFAEGADNGKLFDAMLAGITSQAHGAAAALDLLLGKVPALPNISMASQSGAAAHTAWLAELQRAPTWVDPSIAGVALTSAETKTVERELADQRRQAAAEAKQAAAAAMEAAREQAAADKYAYDAAVKNIAAYDQLAEKQADANLKARNAINAEMLTQANANAKAFFDARAEIQKQQDVLNNMQLSAPDKEIAVINQRRDAEILAINSLKNTLETQKTARIKLANETADAEIAAIDRVTNWWKGSTFERDHQMLPPTLVAAPVVDTWKVFASTLEIVDSQFKHLAQSGGFFMQVLSAGVTAVRNLVSSMREFAKSGSDVSLQLESVASSVVTFYNLAESIAAAQGAAAKLNKEIAVQNALKLDFSTEITSVKALTDSIVELADALVVESDAWQNATSPHQQFMMLKQGAEGFQAAVPTAEALLLPDVLKAQGGTGMLTPGGLTTTIAAVDLLFTKLAKDPAHAVQAIQALDDTFKDFVAHTTDGYGFISDAAHHMIDEMRQTGVVIQSIVDFLKAQATSFAGSVLAIIEGSVDSDRLDALKTRVDAAQTAVEKATTDDARKTAETELTAALADRAHAVDEYKAKLEDLGTIATTAFAAAKASGMTLSQALDAAHPALDRIRKDYEALGLTVEDASLKAMLFFDANKKVIDGLSALAGGIANLSNMNLLDPKTFSAMQRTGNGMINDLYNQAILNGSTGDQAMRMALYGGQDYLHAAQTASQRSGVALDAATAAKIQESKDLGIWVDAARADTDRMLDKLDDILHAIQGLPLAIHDGTPGSSDSPTTPPTTHPTGDLPGDTVPGASTGAWVTAHGLQYLAGGGIAGRGMSSGIGIGSGGGSGIGARFVPHGTDTIPAMLTPGERVLSPRETLAFETPSITWPTPPITATPPPITWPTPPLNYPAPDLWRAQPATDTGFLRLPGTPEAPFSPSTPSGPYTPTDPPPYVPIPRGGSFGSSDGTGSISLHIGAITVTGGQASDPYAMADAINLALRDNLHGVRTNVGTVAKRAVR